MRGRLLLIGGLILLRLLLNFMQISKCRTGELVRISGVAERVTQRGSETVVLIGNFATALEKNPGVEGGERVVLIGKCKKGVIAGVKGEISLIEATIESVEKTDLGAHRVGEIFDRLRGGMSEGLRRQLPDREAALVAGILLGDKSGIGKRFKEELVNSGTIHIAVASGYNISVVGAAVMAIMEKRWRRSRSTLIAGIAIFLYVLLAGAEPPVVRAGIMGGLVLWARVLGRQAEAGWLLVLASLVMWLWRPAVLFEVSFQLSVAATAGLIYLQPRLVSLFERFRNSLIDLLIRLEFTTTLAATAMTAPLIWFHFGRVSLVGLISNLFILQLVPVVMALGAVEVGLNIFGLGGLVAPLVYSLTHLMVVMIEWWG